jgi:hypothetical protein
MQPDSQGVFHRRNRFIQQKGKFFAMKILYAALAACGVFSFATNISSQIVGTVGPIDHSPKAAISLDTGGTLTLVSAQGLFGRVAAQTSQAITVQLQYPADLAGQRIFVQSLDGAQLIGIPDQLVVGADGTATVRLQLAIGEGIYRVAVTCSDSRTLLRFYAVAPGKPLPDPTLLIPVTSP